MIKKRGLKALVLVAVMGALGLTACGNTEGKDRVITIGEGDWESNTFHDQVVKIIVEEGYGNEVEIITADTAVMITGMKTEDIDFVMELWSDNVPTYQEDIDNGDYLELSTNYDDNKQGLYIPTYLAEQYPDLKSVKDLVDYKDLFENPENPDLGVIYGGPEGWGATEFLHAKIKAYGLSDFFEFLPIDSSATLNATLASAYAKGEPWVGYNWEPTWVMGLYDMTILEDTPYSEDAYAEGEGAFPVVKVVVAGTEKFTSEFPEVAAFLENYETSSAITSAALAYKQETDAEFEEVAAWFLLNNEDLWKEWVSEEAYQNVLESLK